MSDDETIRVVIDKISTDAEGTTVTVRLAHSETTLLKVAEALAQCGITGHQAVDVISEILNHGIVFREIKP